MNRPCPFNATMLLAVALVLPLDASAASADSSLNRGFFEVGSLRVMPPNGDGGYLQFGGRASTLETRAPSPDLAIAFLLAPVLTVLPDVDLAWPILVGPDVRLVPRIGGSALLFAGGGAGGLAAGVNLGVGLVFATKGSTPIRVDYTVRRFLGEEVLLGEQLHTISIGVSANPSR